MINKIKNFSLQSLNLPSYFDVVKSLLTYEESDCWSINHELVFGYKKNSKKSWEEIQLIIAHEIMHLILLHPFIKKPDCEFLFQKACDYVVNGMLINKYGLKDLKKYAIYKPDEKWNVKECNKLICIKNLSSIELFFKFCKLNNRKEFKIDFLILEMANFISQCKEKV